MDRMELTRALRADRETHYNCCQATLIPFEKETGLDKDTAYRLGANFASGMKMGSVCGAVTGALMALGLAGAGEEAAREFKRRFKEEHGALNCAELLASAKERGEERKPHCDRMVFDAVALAEELLNK